MKKSLIVFAAVVALGLTVGCGKKSKVLECTKTEERSGVSLKQTIKANFKGNDVESITIDMDAVLPEAYASYKSIYKTAFESEFKKYSDLKGVEVKISDAKDGVNIKLTADLKKMDKDAKDKLDIVDTKASYSKSVKEFEAEGYKCK